MSPSSKAACNQPITFTRGRVDADAKARGERHRWRAPLALLLALLLPACFDAIQAPIGATWFEAPAIYHIWWAADLACTRTRSDYPMVIWFYSVPSDYRGFESSDGRMAMGEWIPPHSVYLADSQLKTERTVRHEMLHDLLGGDPNHQSAAWDRCGVR